MEAKDWIDLVVAILAGVATAIPLICKLVQAVRENVREKNWGMMVGVVLDLMEDAETLFESGAERKEWVVAGALSLSRLVDYDIDAEAIGDLVDRLCDMSKKVNAPPEVPND